MVQRTTVRLADNLMRRLKRKAAAKGTTMTALIEQGVLHVLNEPDQVEKPRIMPRVSSARGGLVPGVDLIDLSKLQEAEDLEYVERMKRGFR
jgi:hypothetical protein